MSLFDFNYYFGESSSSGWLEKALPALTGVVLGFLINRGYDSLKEKAAIKKSGQQFINELELYTEPLGKQIQSLEELMAKLNAPITTDANLVGSIPIDTDRFESIDRLHVYRYFEKIIGEDSKEARRVVNKLYGTLKVCSDEGERLKVLFRDFVKDRRIEVKRFNVSLNDLLGNFSNLIVLLEKQRKPLNQDPLYNALLPVFTIVSEESSMLNIDQLVEKVSTPLTHITAEFRHDDRSIYFSTNNRNCFTAYREYLDVKNVFVYEVKNVHSSLSQLNIQLIALLEKYGSSL